MSESSLREPSPRLARAAGVLLAWLGVLIGLGGLPVIAGAVFAPTELTVAAGVVVTLLGVAVAVSGWELARGRADDTDAAFTAGFFIVLVMSAVVYLTKRWLIILIAWGSLTPFVVVIVLALAGRPGYLKWRAWQASQGKA